MLTLQQGGLRFVVMGPRFVLPPNLTLKNFEGLDLGHMEKVRREKLPSLGMRPAASFHHFSV